MRKLKNSELNRIDISTFKSIKKTPLIIILDDVRSLNNIGSIFRTSDAFLIDVNPSAKAAAMKTLKTKQQSS